MNNANNKYNKKQQQRFDKRHRHTHHNRSRSTNPNYQSNQPNQTNKFVETFITRKLFAVFALISFQLRRLEMVARHYCRSLFTVHDLSPTVSRRRLFICSFCLADKCCTSYSSPPTFSYPPTNVLSIQSILIISVNITYKEKGVCVRLFGCVEFFINDFSCHLVLKCYR